MPVQMRSSKLDLMKAFVILACAALLLGSLLGCLPVNTTSLPPLPSATLLPSTATATPTIVWFPPTATYTPIPTGKANPLPTQPPPIEHGALLFEDAFDDEKNWTLGKNFAGSAALGQNELSLVVSIPRGYLFSSRHGNAAR